MVRAVDLVPVKGLLVSINQVLIARSLLLDNKPPQLEYFREQFALYWSALKVQLKEQIRNTVDMHVAGEYNQILLDAYNIADTEAQKIISSESKDSDEVIKSLREIHRVFAQET